MKGLSTEDLTTRNDLVLALPDRIQAIPDGTATSTKKNGGWTSSASRTEIKFDSGDALNSVKFRSTIFVNLSTFSCGYHELIISLICTFELIKTGDLMMSTSNTLRSRVSSGKSMKCGK